ncbi:uncharacterized protein LOC119727822 [Patiria miniata]|uniref:MULE transposase domain-containing protein n=1 Tax=Patiria miniata TaxID=46514 RepID=A0A913ZWC1_PATMI|nr:uncharacterized protein LOC119727822 [Patiria miniata]
MTTADNRISTMANNADPAMHQLHVLDGAKTWYLDGTFKLVKRPFTQLFSVHAFVKGDTGGMKQVPLTFVLITRRTKKDYKKVLKALRRKLPSRAANLQELVVDFKVGLWGAIRAVFPDASVNCRLFHWTQAVWRKCQALDLAVPYMSNDGVRDFIGQLLSLPFLPNEHIGPAFKELSSLVTDQPAMVELCSYPRTTWLENSTWSPRDWNQRRMYMYQQVQGKIFKLWDDYQARRLTTSGLLAACKYLTGPAL